MSYQHPKNKHCPSCNVMLTPPLPWIKVVIVWPKRGKSKLYCHLCAEQIKQEGRRDARIEEELDRPLPSDYIQEIEDLRQRLTYVIENYVVCEENSFTFPDGYTWKRE